MAVVRVLRCHKGKLIMLNMNKDSLVIPLDPSTAKAFAKMSASQKALAVKGLSQGARLFVKIEPPKGNKSKHLARIKKVFGKTTKYAKKAGITQKDIDEATL